MADYLTVLRTYATRKCPQKLPPNVLFDYTDASIAVFDAYPKAVFHFLILPRPRPPLSVLDLSDLRTLLRSSNVDKQAKKHVLEQLQQHAQRVTAAIEDEMLSRYGFKWDIWTGFHAVPSMQHLHLHVISADLCAPALKKKKHYNSFHPSLGFFLPLPDVLAWFDAVPSFFDDKAALRALDYEPLLARPLECHKCGKVCATIPALKDHLQREFDAAAARARPPPSPPKPPSTPTPHPLVKRKRKPDTAVASGSKRVAA